MEGNVYGVIWGKHLPTRTGENHGSLRIIGALFKGRTSYIVNARQVLLLAAGRFVIPAETTRVFGFSFFFLFARVLRLFVVLLSFSRENRGHIAARNA